MAAEDFQQRVVQARNADLESNLDESLYCKACKKKFLTKNAHDNHLGSKKHKLCLKSFVENHCNEEGLEVRVSVPLTEIIEERRKQVEDDDENMDAESVNSDEWNDDSEPVNSSDCVFCDHHSKNMVKNLKHMAIAHSFFIPDAEFCCDIEGLLVYLGGKVSKDYICLWCNEKGRTFYSTQGVRQHMIEKGHTKMLHEGIALAEYVDFYDYSSSYPDHDDTKDVDAILESAVLEGDEYQLVLPSGNVIGHRSLMKYYKQRLNPNRQLVLKKSDRKLNQVMADYRALGMGKLQQEAVYRKAKDIHMMKRTQAKLYMQVGCKGNKLIKKYRPQITI